MKRMVSARRAGRIHDNLRFRQGSLRQHGIGNHANVGDKAYKLNLIKICIT